MWWDISQLRQGNEKVLNVAACSQLKFFLKANVLLLLQINKTSTGALHHTQVRVQNYLCSRSFVAFFHAFGTAEVAQNPIASVHSKMSDVNCNDSHYAII